MNLHHLQGVLSMYFAKVIKIIKFTNHYDVCNSTGLEMPFALQDIEAPKISKQSEDEGSNVVRPRTGRLYPPLFHRKNPWYLFLLETGSIPGPYCGRKDYVNIIPK